MFRQFNEIQIRLFWRMAKESEWKLRLPVGGAEREALINGELDEFGIALQPKLLHDAVLVESDCPCGHAEHARGFLHCEPFGEQLKDFALAGGKF